MNEELKASEALLDIGISVPLRPLGFRKWKIVPRVTIKRPPLGGLLRILRIFFTLGITVEQLDKMDNTERLHIIETSGRAISTMVALMVCNGYLSGKLLAPLLSFFLRWRCHPDTMMYTVSVFMQLLDTKSFMTIIKSVAALNVAAPKLSQKKRS